MKNLFISIRNILIILLFISASSSGNTVSAQLYPTTCTGTCMSACDSGYVQGSGTCGNGMECCVPYNTTTCTAQGGTCRGSCNTGETGGSGDCVSGVCCVTYDNTCVAEGGECRNACLTGQVSSGRCSGGNTCCKTASPQPTGSILNCTENLGCAAKGCIVGTTWIATLSCPATLSDGTANDCVIPSNCVTVGGTCIASVACTGCRPTSCTAVCGLGGCPGGCGSQDDCGGVSCNACPGSASCGDGYCSGGEDCGNCASDWIVTTGKSIVVFVDGDLTINRRINLPATG